MLLSQVAFVRGETGRLERSDIGLRERRVQLRRTVLVPAVGGPAPSRVDAFGLAPFPGIDASHDLPAADRLSVGCKPQDGVERDVAVETPVVTEDELVPGRVDVPAAQALGGATP